MRVHIWTKDGHAGMIPHVERLRLIWPTRDRQNNPDERANVTERVCELNMRHVIATLIEPEGPP